MKTNSEVSTERAVEATIFLYSCMLGASCWVAKRLVEMMSHETCSVLFSELALPSKRFLNVQVLVLWH